jgi:hypothetical protein
MMACSCCSSARSSSESDLSGEGGKSFPADGMDQNRSARAGAGVGRDPYHSAFAATHVQARLGPKCGELGGQSEQRLEQKC